jgi:hypothetical protein
MAAHRACGVCRQLLVTGNSGARFAVVLAVVGVVPAYQWLGRVGMAQLAGPLLVAVIVRELGPLLFKWDQGFPGGLHGTSWVLDQYVGTEFTIPGGDAAKRRVGDLPAVSNAVEEDPRTNQRAKVVKLPFSDHQGSAQPLPNGNTLIVSGYAARSDEVDEDGQVVWSRETPGRIAHAPRYEIEHPGVAELKGGQTEHHRALVSYFTQSSSLTGRPSQTASLVAGS